MNWDAFAQAVTVLGIGVGVWIYWANVRASRSASALQVHKEYLKLCLDEAEFSSTEQYLRSHPDEHLDVLAEEQTRPATRYIWFLSFMLNSLEQTLEYVSDRGEWRKVALSQVSYHDRALAEVWAWQEWADHYGAPLTRVVEEILGRDATRLPQDLVRRARASAEADGLREKLRDRPPRPPGWSERIGNYATPVLGAGLTGMAVGVLLTWSIVRNSASETPDPIQPPAPVIPPPEPTPGPHLDLGFDIGQVLLALVALSAVVIVGRMLYKKASALLPAMLPAASAVASTVRANEFIRLSDDLHNLLTAMLFLFAFLTALAAYVGTMGNRRLRVALLLVLTAVPASFSINPMRTMFVQSLFTGGLVEAIYVSILGAIAAFGFIWSVVKGIRKPAH